jgi:hypothetical protein
MAVDSIRWPPRTAWAVTALAVLFTFIGSSARAQETDLDALMARALERRNETWRALHDYVLDERERFSLAGPSDVRLYGQDRQYTWYVRDGILVRSPVRINGVAVPESDRREYEAKWLSEEQSRAERQQKRVAEKAVEAKAARAKETEAAESPVPESPGPGAAPPEGGASPGDAPAEVVAKGLEPRFVSEANFLRFRFERGRYFLVGRDTLDGRPVLKIEYYPKKLFVDSDEPGRKPPKENPDPVARDTGKARQDQIERQFNKVSMVTLWVDPAESQIVRYDFENLGLDFFPGQWLVRVGETSASMTMGRYFDGVWLPKAIVMKGDLQVAIGSFDIAYRREFLEYRKAETAARIRSYGDVK